jgi:Spy/CpxP family protein refolding chaperone
LAAIAAAVTLVTGGMSVASADHMMGRGMMGQGMMTGEPNWGPGMMGPGMMGPGMMGPGMMGMGPGGYLNLDETQRTKIFEIQQGTRKKYLELMAQLNQEQYKLQELYMADKRNPKAIGDEYQKLEGIQRKMIELSVDTQNRIEDVLTDEQKEQLRSSGHWWGMGPMMGRQHN